MMKRLFYPFKEGDVRSLKAGDTVLVTGKVFTGRDRFHKHFADGGRLPVDFRDGALFHCGPVVVNGRDEWRVVAAGPTTSVRENPYEPAFIRASGVRLVIGKGGMDDNTLAACGECGCVYLQAVGGAAALTAACVKRVAAVHFLDEWGAAEACWEFEMEDFPCVVAMDSHGKSLFAAVAGAAASALSKLVRRMALAAALLGGAIGADAGDVSAHGTFVQRKVLRDVDVTLTSTGTWSFEKDVSFVWRTVKPVPSEFVATPTNYMFSAGGRASSHRLAMKIENIAQIFEIKEMKEFVDRVETNSDHPAFSSGDVVIPSELRVFFKNGDRLEISLAPTD